MADGRRRAHAILILGAAFLASANCLSTRLIRVCLPCLCSLKGEGEQPRRERHCRIVRGRVRHIRPYLAVAPPRDIACAARGKERKASALPCLYSNAAWRRCSHHKTLANQYAARSHPYVCNPASTLLSFGPQLQLSTVLCPYPYFPDGRAVTIAQCCRTALAIVLLVASPAARRRA